MKKIFYFAAMMALCLSCTKEQQGGSDVIEGDVDSGEVVTATEFSAEFSQEGISKTHLGTLSDGAYPNYWSVGDCINVNGSVSAALGSEYSTNSRTARFLFDNAVSQYGGNWYIGYPGGAFTSFSAGTGTVVVPSSQTYTAGTYDPEAFVMVGKANGKSVKFYPKMGIVRITATDAATPYSYKISKVRLEAIGGESLSGTFTTDYNNASATFTSTSGNSYVEINAPTSAGLDFGSTFFFAVPIGTYASGLRFTIFTKDDKSMSFSNSSSISVAAGTMKNITSPAYLPSVITVSCNFKTSSSLGIYWTGSNASSQNNFKKAWRLAVYSDADCNTLVVQHDIPEDGDKDDWWSGQSGNGNPHFMVGGLSGGTTYYCKVTDLGNNVSSSVTSFTTDAFTPVSASSPSGSTLVAEDFSEFGWGPAYNGGGTSAAHRYAGWSPVNGVSSGLSFAAPTGVVTTGYYVPYNYSSNTLTSNFDYSTAPRFKGSVAGDGWGYANESGFNGCPQAGHLRMGTASGSKRSFIVCPTLPGITSGKYATVDVTVRVAHMTAEDVTNNENFAVFVESGLTLNESRREYSGATLNRRYPVSLTSYAQNSQILTFRVNGLQSTDHLMVGVYNNVAGYNRYTLFSVKVDKVSESDTEIFDITDPETLELFRSRVAAGESSLNGNVVNSFTVSSAFATAWTPIAGYTGTLEGNDKTITGLTQPFFDDLEGAVQNLNLNSNISISNITRESVGILANSMSGYVEGCSVTGSLTVSYSTSESPSGGCYAGGIVGKVSTGYVTDSENSANITVSGTANSHLYIGGIVANNTAGSYAMNNCRSTGGTISYTGSNPAGNLYIGGIVGYSTRPISSCTSSMTVNMGGSFEGTSSKFYSVGGIVGSMSANQTISSCLNTGNITYSQQISNSGYSFLGGVAGRTQGSIENSSNGGTVTWTGNNTVNQFYVGGLVGTTDNAYSHSITGKYSTSTATNYGTIVVNSSYSTGKNAIVGGVIGRLHTSGSLEATNAGPVNVTRLTCNALEVGGVAGYNNAPISSGTENLAAGDITISGLTASADSHVGGVVGISYSTVTANNAGDVKATSGSTCATSFFIGGIAGRGQSNISNCTNTGLVSNACPVTGSSKYIQVGGIVGYNNTSCAISNCHNRGNVTNTANSAAYLYVGGITSESDKAISNCDNTGNVTNSGNSGNGKPIAVGGIAGCNAANITSSSNGTSTAAGGTISNSGTSAEDVCVGGIAGINKKKNQTLTTCYNKGAVSNSGNSAAGYNLDLGGLIGWSDSTKVVAPCYNTGAVSNTGAGSNSTAAVRMGGLIGCAENINDFAGTSSTYNYNSGTVTENSSSPNPCVGGICGYSLTDASDFTYCANRSGGNITIKNGSLRDNENVCVGGILGCSEVSTILTSTSNAGNIYLQNLSGINCLNVGGIIGLAGDYALPDISGSDDSHRTLNSGNIEFTTCSISGALRAGGIIGWWDNTLTYTLEYCSNSGTISTYTKTVSSADLYITATGNSHVGGIVGGSSQSSNQTYKTIQNCNNTNGHITIYSRGRFRIGGIGGLVTNPMSNCSCTANVTYGRNEYATTTDRSMVGGVIGYFISGSRTFTNVHYNGTVDTSGSYCFASGILGYTGYNSTFDNCSIQGSIKCADKLPGLFFCDNTQYTIKCKNGCTVKSGTTLISSSGTTIINSTSDFTQTNVVGGGGTTSSLPIANLSVN